MFTNTPFYQGYPQSQAPNTSGMNASQAPIPDHSQISLPQPGPMAGSFDPSLGQPFANSKPKRKQVKNACTNCQKACKKCDDQRPCPRCVKYGQTETCVDSVRKERQKGLKRGPYKKRKQGDAVEGNVSGAANMPVTGLPNGMYSTPTTGAYQGYGNTAAQFENFPQFQHGHYLQYNLLNNMSSIIQQAAANANANSNGTAKDQQSMNGGNHNNNNSDNKTSTEVDENGKLNILSQLCTAVLDHDPKATDASTENIKGNGQNKATPPSTAEPNSSQSNTNSRESTTAPTSTNNNESTAVESTEPKQTAPGNTNTESEDDQTSRYGTPEAENDDGKTMETKV